MNYNQLNILVGAGVSIVCVLGVYFYQKKKKPSVPKKWKAVGKVSELYLYPLKSGRRLSLSEAECTEFGLKQITTKENKFQLRDRFLVIYDEYNKEFKSAKVLPKIALIEVSTCDYTIVFKAPSMEPLSFKLPTNYVENLCEITLRKEKIKAIDCGNEIAKWLSNYILSENTGLRLGLYFKEERRNYQKAFTKHLSVYPSLTRESTGMFSDITSYMLINNASIRDLRSKVQEDVVLSANNFRPNIVIDDLYLQPYVEDTWEWIKIGENVFKVILPCTRCVFVNVDPDTGNFDKNREPLKTLESYRLHTDPKKKAIAPRSPIMGIQIALISKGNPISVNDVVYVENN